MKKNNTPLEDEESKTLAQYLDLLVTQKKICVYTHTANETYTKSWMQKRRNKAMGVRGGIPDYVIVTTHNVIFLELKRRVAGRLSPTQKDWREALERVTVQGNQVYYLLALGFDHAKQQIDSVIK